MNGMHNFGSLRKATVKRKTMRMLSKWTPLSFVSFSEPVKP